MNPPPGRTLLIAEDDAHLRELLHAAAIRSGRFATIDLVPDGEAALDYIRGSAAVGAPKVPDFVLTDLSMPRLTGVELIRELKRDEATRHIPIAVMTSSNLPNDREDATTAGCCAFFAKPVRFEDMVLLIGSLPNICGAKAPAAVTAA